MLEVAAGNIPNTSSVNVFGRNLDVDIAASEDIWSGGGTWTAPTQARTHDIVSTDTNDDGGPAGTGARTVKIYGLTDWSTAEVTETITMNGTTNVSTSNSYVIIHKMEVTASGSSGPNIGTITATAQTDSTVTARIEPGIGQTEMAIYGIPSTQSAYLVKIHGSILDAATGDECNYTLLHAPFPDTEETVFLTKMSIGGRANGSTSMQYGFKPYNKLPGPGILKLQATVDADNQDIGAGFDLILVNN